MSRTKTKPRRVKGKKTYILKRKLQTPKVVRFGNTQFTVRYERIGVKTIAQMRRYSLSSRGKALKSSEGKVKKRRGRHKKSKNQNGGGVILGTIAAQTESKVIDSILGKIF